MRNKLLILTLISLLITGCANMGDKQVLGGAIGAAGGGLLGSQIGGGSGQLAAVAAGTLLGALIGGSVGQSMDELDRLKAAQAYQTAYQAPLGEQINWNNNQSGHYGSVTPVRDGYTSTGLYCREFSQEIYIGGRSDQAYGTACREPNGSWRIVNK
jgi:surface antigen